MKCQVCGKENDIDAKYCVDCGALLTKTEEKDPYQVYEVQEKPYNSREAYAKPAMILGLVSLGFGIICCFGPLSIIISIVCGILAIVFSILAMKTTQKGKAVTGLVCGIIGLLFGIMLLTIMILFNDPAFLAYLQENYPEFWQAFQDALQQYQ